MGDRLATIDISRKVGGCCAPFRGGTAAPHFWAHVDCLCLCRFLDRPFSHRDAGWWKRTCSGWNQQLYGGCPSMSLIPIAGFSVNLASNHCVISLQNSIEHFPSTGTTRAICIRNLNFDCYHTRFLCPISYDYDSLFSTFSSIMPAT